MNAIIEKMIRASNKTTIQTLVRDFNIERLGYMHPEIIEENISVKRGTASFGIAVSELFSEYKVDKIRLEELNSIIRTSSSKYKLHYSIDVKKEQLIIHNEAVQEFNELNKPLSLFVKRCNKILNNK